MTSRCRWLGLGVSLLMVLSGIQSFQSSFVPSAMADTTGRTTVPAGVPATPTPSTPDGSLTAHPLTSAPGPIQNPLKGYLPYWFSGTNYSTGYLPHSMQWQYFPLSDLMTDWNTYNWSDIEGMLDEVGGQGRQSNFRVYLDYPARQCGTPQFLVNSGVTIQSDGCMPNWDDPRTIQMLENFIAAFGAKYDGDGRIGFQTLGLVGYWGEWHTWPEDGVSCPGGPVGCPNWMASDATVNTIIDAYEAALKITPMEIRYAALGGGTHLTSVANVGYHDDSYCYDEFRSGSQPPYNPSDPYSDTLPVSINGWQDSFLQKELNAGAENKWITSTIGGEVRPEIQAELFSGGSQVDPWQECLELTHTTWDIDQDGVDGAYSASDPTVQAGLREMGYNLTVDNAYFNNVSSGQPLKVGVQIENTGVAPFAYDHQTWPVLIGLENGSGSVVQTWQTTWDLDDVMPRQIRAFPDWNTGQTYLPYGQPYYFGASLPWGGVAAGTYTIVMRVQNPLELDAAALQTFMANLNKGLNYATPVPFEWANTGEDSNGWLTLGSVTLSGTGGPTWTPTATYTPRPTPTFAPTFTPGPGSPTATATVTPGGPTFTPSATPTGTATSTPTYTPSNTATNTPAGPTATNTPTGGTIYEADASGNTLAGGAVIAACSTCLDGHEVGYVGMGGTLTFNNVSAASAGTYNMTIYYLDGDSGRSATMQVNGGTGTGISFPGTGSWTNVGTYQTTVTLNAGSSNTIEFSNASAWAPDFDHLTIYTTAGPTNTPTNTPVPATNTPTNTPVAPTNTPTKTNTPTNTPVPATNTPTNTPVPATNTPTKTNTPVPATNTPTNTPVPATNTPTNTPVAPTNTPTKTNTPTNTPVGPTNTPTKTNTPVPPTSTPTNTPVGPTNTPTKTNTPVPATSTPTKTNTPTNTPVPATATPTNTPGAGTSYEAESSGNTLVGSATIESCSACSGGEEVGYIGYGDSNGYLVFNGVSVGTAGNHTVTVYYTSDAARYFNITTNGAGSPQYTHINVSSTGGFNTTPSSVQETVSLNSGSNTIKISNDSTLAPFIDRIVVQ